jgi:hypothetical protein
MAARLRELRAVALRRVHAVVRITDVRAHHLLADLREPICARQAGLVGSARLSAPAAGVYVLSWPSSQRMR